MILRNVAAAAVASLIGGCSSGSGATEPSMKGSTPPVSSSEYERRKVDGDPSMLVPAATPTGTPAPRTTSSFLVPDAERLRTEAYRCSGRPLERNSYPRTLDAMMTRLRASASALAVLPKERVSANRFFVGLRACGLYRSLTIADAHQWTKLIYDSNGALVAVLESTDVVDIACGNDPESATIHYGQSIDCIEAELIYPPR